jgi:hypothetical protein
MSNDKKTLADAQPGGRVRLGDAVLPCPFCGAPAERIDFGIGSGENEGGSCIACTVCQHSGPIEFGFKENFVSNWNRRTLSTRQAEGRSFQTAVAEWMGQCFLPSLYSNMTERGDRLLEEVLELLQAHGYDKARVRTLVDYVFERPIGDPAQEVGGVMVTLAGYCWVAGLDMHVAGDAELARINQPEVMAKIRTKQEAKNALHFDTPLPGNVARQPVGEPVGYACTNCDRTDEVAICPTCAGMAWDNGRLHEFHEVRELSTSLGEGVLDHLLPDEWHEKPLLRFQGAFDEGDRSVGIGERCGNVLAADQSGTVLGDYLAARTAKEGGQ